MRRRQLGGTGLEVSELGYGAWGIGRAMWQGADDDTSLRALARAFESSVPPKRSCLPPSGPGSA